MRIVIPPPPSPFLDLTTAGGLPAVLPAQQLLPYESSDVNASFYCAFSPNGTDNEAQLYVSAGVLTLDDATARLSGFNAPGNSLGQLHFLDVSVARKPGSTGAIDANTVIVKSQALRSCSADNTTDVFTCAMHGLDNGDLVQFTGTVPTNISLATDYVVRDRTRNTFKVAATLGGSAVDFSDNGSSLNVLSRRREIARLEVAAAAAGDEPVADHFRFPFSAGSRWWPDFSTYPLYIEYANSDTDLEIRVAGVGEA